MEPSRGPPQWLRGHYSLGSLPRCSVDSRSTATRGLTVNTLPPEMAVSGRRAMQATWSPPPRKTSSQSFASSSPAFPSSSPRCGSPRVSQLVTGEALSPRAYAIRRPVVSARALPPKGFTGTQVVSARPLSPGVRWAGLDKARAGPTQTAGIDATVQERLSQHDADRVTRSWKGYSSVPAPSPVLSPFSKLASEESPKMLHTYSTTSRERGELPSSTRWQPADEPLPGSPRIFTEVAIDKAGTSGLPIAPLEMADVPQRPIVDSAACATLLRDISDNTGQEEVIRTVLRTMQGHEDDPAIQVAASVVLEGITSDDTGRLAVMRAGGIVRLTKTMEKHPLCKDVQEAAYRVLANLRMFQGFLGSFDFGSR